MVKFQIKISIEREFQMHLTELIEIHYEKNTGHR